MDTKEDLPRRLRRTRGGLFRQSHACALGPWELTPQLRFLVFFVLFEFFVVALNLSIATRDCRLDIHPSQLHQPLVAGVVDDCPIAPGGDGLGRIE